MGRRARRRDRVAHLEELQRWARAEADRIAPLYVSIVLDGGTHAMVYPSAEHAAALFEELRRRGMRVLPDQMEVERLIAVGPPPLDLAEDAGPLWSAWREPVGDPDRFVGGVVLPPRRRARPVASSDGAG